MTMITALALLLTAYVIITEIRLFDLRSEIKIQSDRIDGLLDLIDGDGDD